MIDIAKVGSFFKKYEKIILYILIVSFIIFLGTRDYSSSIGEKEYNELSNTFKTKRLKDSSLIVFQREIIIQKNSNLRNKIEEVEGLKKIKQQVKVVIKYKVVNIPISVPGMPILTIDTINYLKLPWKFNKETKWYTYGFTIKKKEIELNNLSFYDSLTLSYGSIKKPGLKNIFSRQIPTVAFQSKNPYSMVQDIKNITVESKESRIGLDVQIGYGVTSTGLSPFVGIGLGYRLKFFNRK